MAGMDGLIMWLVGHEIPLAQGRESAEEGQAQERMRVQKVVAAVRDVAVMQ